MREYCPPTADPKDRTPLLKNSLNIEKAKELAAANGTAEDFIHAMQEAFPNYDGENYLEMTAGCLYQ